MSNTRTENINDSPNNSPPDQFVRIPYSFSEITKQVDDGISSVRYVSTILEKWCDTKLKYAKEMKKFLENNKFLEKKKILQIDKMVKSAECISQLTKLIEDEAQKELEFANSVKSKIIAPLKKQCEEATTQKNEILKEKNLATTQLMAAVDVLEKTKRSCENFEEKIDTPPHSPISSSPLQKARSMSNMGIVFKKNKQKQREKMGESIKRYEGAIAAANQHQTKYYSEDMPKIFNKLEILEKARLSNTKSHFQNLYLYHLGLINTANSDGSTFLKHIKDIDPQNEIKIFVNAIVDVRGPASNPLPYSYEARFRPEHLTLNRQFPRNSVVGSTLEDHMRMQVETHPDLTVPLVFLKILQAIRDTNGTRTEGIFRVSIDQQLLCQLRSKLAGISLENNIDEVDFENVTEPHAAAVLLKIWFRSLVGETVFPSSMYTKCIYLGKEAEQKGKAKKAIVQLGIEEDEENKIDEEGRKVNEQKNQDGTTNSAPTMNEWRIEIGKSVTEELPKLSQGILEELMTLFSEIYENIKETKMDFRNLAIIFAPILLQNPERHSADPLTLLSNAKYETQFLHHFFLGLHTSKTEK